ncbi:MAG TPA: hypothetical protein VFW28_05290 [Micropepsaceae bacterium]|nr:hypothetical protein [Micropepsaceae bacterium]
MRLVLIAMWAMAMSTETGLARQGNRSKGPGINLPEVVAKMQAAYGFVAFVALISSLDARGSRNTSRATQAADVRTLH